MEHLRYSIETFRRESEDEFIMLPSLQSVQSGSLGDDPQMRKRRITFIQLTVPESSRSLLSVIHGYSYQIDMKSPVPVDINMILHKGYIPEPERQLKLPGKILKIKNLF